MHADSKNTDSTCLLKLNLGCGINKMDGFVNLYRHGEPDLLHDLEDLPWPFADSSARLIVLNHVLEHLGATPATFIDIMKELYRVGANKAKIQIAVPHPRHDDFLNDPTHVRAVTPELLSLFSMEKCRARALSGVANSPLALYYGIDFELIDQRVVIDEPYWSEYRHNQTTLDRLQRMARENNNVVKELRMTVMVIKPARFEGQLARRGLK